MALNWQEPPARARRGHSPFDEIAAELRTNPKRWALVRHYDNPDSAAGYASMINRAGTAAFPAGEFEAVSRGGDLYVRYTGE